MGYKGDMGNSIGEHEEYFVSDEVMEIMDTVNEYKTEKDFTSLNEGQNLIETAKITLNGYINYIKRKK